MGVLLTCLVLALAVLALLVRGEGGGGEVEVGGGVRIEGNRTKEGEEREEVGGVKVRRGERGESEVGEERVKRASFYRSGGDIAWQVRQAPRAQQSIIRC